MVRDAQRQVAEPPDSSTLFEREPRMFHRPVEPPPELGHATELEALHSLRVEVAAQLDRARSKSFRVRARTWAGRISGRADRRMAFALARADDALAAHCDAIVDRLNTQQYLYGEVTSVLGEELALLRAEVIHLRRQVADLEQRP